MTRRRTIDNYRDLPLSRTVTSLRLPQSVSDHVKAKGTGWLRNLITNAALAELQSDESDTLQKA